MSNAMTLTDRTGIVAQQVEEVSRVTAPPPVFAKLAMIAVFGLFLNGVASILGGLTKASGDWWGNLMIIIGAIWVTIVFAEQIISQSMSMIFQVPDKVFAWIGGQFGSHVGSDMGAQVSGKAEGGFSRAGTGAHHLADHGFRGMGGRNMSGMPGTTMPPKPPPGDGTSNTMKQETPKDK
jgi:hypothetical protein